MRIMLENFNYKGHHIERYGFDFPQLKDCDEYVAERLIVYIKESLDEHIKEES